MTPAFVLPLTLKRETMTWSVVFANHTAALNAQMQARQLPTVQSTRLEERPDGWHLIIVEETF